MHWPKLSPSFNYEPVSRSLPCLIISNKLRQRSPPTGGFESHETEAVQSLYRPHEKSRANTRRFSWLGRRFLKITFSQQEDDPIVDVEEIRELLDEDIKEGDDE